MVLFVIGVAILFSCEKPKTAPEQDCRLMTAEELANIKTYGQSTLGAKGDVYYRREVYCPTLHWGKSCPCDAPVNACTESRCPVCGAGTVFYVYCPGPQ